MTAVIAYDLKECLPAMTPDHRWTVLTVLVLHANIRNRCFVGMDTIAQLACSGNKSKATRAKQWLQKHGAFTLVPYDKRVEEERDLPKRQHVYQLSGKLRQCFVVGCPCQKWTKPIIPYLYHAEKPAETPNVLPIKNIKDPDVLSIENFNRAKVLPIENFNGENVTIPNITRDKGVVGSRVEDGGGYSSLDTEALSKRFDYYRAFEAGYPEGAKTKISDTARNRNHAREVFLAGYSLDEVTALVRSKLATGHADYRFYYLMPDLAQARLERNASLAPRPVPPEVITNGKRIVPYETDWRRDAQPDEAQS